MGIVQIERNEHLITAWSLEAPDNASAIDPDCLCPFNSQPQAPNSICFF